MAQSALKRIVFEIQPVLYARDPAHDFDHAMRVYGAAARIGKQEGADMEILLAAALLHDIVTIPKKSLESSKKSVAASVLSAVQILRRVGFSKEKIEKVSQCIQTHSFSCGLAPMSLEAKILQDADRLDALGAIGIARTFSVSGSEKRTFYNNSDPQCKHHKLDDKRWTIDHFDLKLLKLAENMHTELAKKIALERTQFMQLFLGQLQEEISFTEGFPD